MFSTLLFANNKEQEEIKRDLLVSELVRANLGILPTMNRKPVPF